MTNKSWYSLNRIRSWKAIGDKQQELKRLEKSYQKEVVRQNNAHTEEINRKAHTLSEIATITSSNQKVKK